MHDHREADVAHLGRHVAADALPAPTRAIEPVDAAMVLLVETIGVAGAEADAVRVVEGDVAGVETGDDLHAPRPAARSSRRHPGTHAHAAAGHREVEMLRVARSTMIECSLGPSGVPSCTVPNHWRYCGSSLMQENGAQLRPPSIERNRPCGEVPAYQTSGSLACAGASQNVVDAARVEAVLRRAEGGRRRGFLPGLAKIGGAEDRRPEVAGLRGGEAACGRRAGRAQGG